MMRAALFTLLFAGCISLRAQLVVNNAAPYNNIAYLVQNVLLGKGVLASNVVYTGDPGAIGYFNGLNTNLSLDSGIIITSGDLQSAVGPNTLGGAGFNNGQGGDAQLEQMTGQTSGNTFDAAILEFDFVANADTVKFDYVFGSEEYMEFVNSGFNDAFAFIISGVTTPLAPTNIALIPSPPAPANTPVTIDNVNLNQYPQFYVNNETPPGQTVQYDGFTKVLTAIFPIKCGETYHIKIAIADVLDHIFDSGVFLRAGSFSSAGVQISADLSYGGLNDSTLYEGCGQACIKIDRGTANIANPDTVVMAFSGVAVNGLDITLLPDTVFFAIGQQTITICIQGLVDTLNEGPETMTLMAALLGNSLCSSSDTAYLTLYIDDHTPLSISAAFDTVICPGMSVNLLATPTGGVNPISYQWSPSTGLSNPNISNPVATPSTTTTYVIAVSDSCNAPKERDSVTVTVYPPGPIVINAPDITVCLNGDLVSLNATVNGGAAPYNYFWATVAGNDSLINTSSSGPTLIPTGTGTFAVQVSDQCGNFDTALVYLATEECVITIPNVISADGDGMNDLFVIDNLGKFPNSRLVIYDRWGVKLFDSPDYKNNWDAHGYSDGTYYYVLYRSDGEVFPGFLTVLRQ